MRLLGTFIFLSILSIGFGQPSIANYTTARTTGNTYNSISSTGNAFDSWRYTGGAPLSQDDNRSDLTDIGFDFWYNGIRYTQFSISTNGYMDFSASVDDGGPTADDYGYQNTAFSNATVASGTYLAIAPFYDDQTAQGGTGALGNSLKYLLSGTAPNRVLTVEWINMAVYGNTSPSLNYQVKLYETTGVIEINYGTMTQGTAGFTYTMGINGPVISNPPTALQMKVLQTVNTNTFSNAVQNSLAAMPTAGSRYTFTPPTPTVAAGALTFTGVTAIGMTLNWPNWATNETGYVVYNSTDGVNYSFVSQTAANATSTAITGLLPSTTYFWKLYAVTEGRLSASLNGTQATLAGGNVISVASGLWNTGATWNTGVVPTAADNVTITSTHTVTIDGPAVALCNNLTVGQGLGAVLRFGNNNTARTLTVNNNITINTNATFNVNAASNITHTAIIKGNIVNDGTLNFATDALSLCNATFQKSGNQTISGSGAVTTFNNIIVNLGTSINNTLEITTPTFVAPNDFLTLTTGTFKLSTSGASNITPYTVAITVPQKGALWLNSAASTINFGTTVTMYGNITVSNGTMNIGNAADEDLISNGGYLTTAGGTLNIAGKYYSIGINNLSKFNINSGSVIVPAFGSTNTTTAPFQITGAGSQFSMTGGTLIIPREGGTGAQNLGFVNTGTSGGTVTGGTLQIGNAGSPAGQIIQINSTYPVGNLEVNSANVTATLLTNSLNVMNNVTLTAGTLNSNNLNFTLGGNWTNNGGTFTPGTGTVTFNGTAAQAINGTAATQIFNNVIIAKTAGTTLSSGGSTTTVTTNNLTETTGDFTAPATLNITGSATAALTLSAGTFTAGPNTFINGNWTNNGGTFVPGTGTVTFSGTGAQAINGTAASQTFNSVVLAKTAGQTLSSGGSTTTITTNDYTQTTGNFTAPATLNVTAGTASNILLTAGTLTAGTQINVTGNWTNNGATFTPGTGTVTFTGTTAQTIFKSGGETFNHAVFSNAGTKTLGSPITTNGDFTINTGSTFDVSALNYLVTIKQNFSNSGTLTANSGNIFLNGTTAQTIGGTTITNFYDLTLNNAAGASLLQSENIINSLVLNGGIFDVNSKNFTLISTATGSGRIAQITGTGDIIGNVIVQRYAPGGYTGWAYLGAPLTSALTYAAWDDDIPISCSTCPDGSAGGFLSIYSYNETATGLYDDAASYIPISTISDPIVNGVGYWVYFGDGFTTTNNITLDVTGTVRKGNYTVPLSYTNTGSAVDDGWNLISNPYPSPISWSLLKGATAGIDNAIYVYNADLNGGTGSHASYVNGISSPAVGAGGIGNTIPICQGFYVHSTGATSLSAQESNKIGGNPTFLRQLPGNTNEVNEVPQALIRLYLDGLNTYHDETVLYLQAGATDSFDLEYDSYKMVGGDVSAPSIALQNNTDVFQINGVAPIVNNVSIPVKTTTGYAGNFTITADNISSFPVGACISLYDRYTGITTDLRNDTYTFSLSDTTLTARFTLNITIDPLVVNTSTNDPTCVQPNSGQIIAVGNNSGPWNYYWKDENGIPVKTSLNKADPDTLNALTGGVYLLDMNTVGACDNNSTQFTINNVNLPHASFTCEDTTYISSGATITIVNTSTNSIVNTWNFGDGSGTLIANSPGYTYSQEGVYTVVLITESATSCIDSTTQVVVVINDATGIKTAVSEGDLIIKTISEGQYTVQQKLKNIQEVSLVLYDALGKPVIDFGRMRSAFINVDIDLREKMSGTYYLKIISEQQGVQTIKIIKY